MNNYTLQVDHSITLIIVFSIQQIIINHYLNNESMQIVSASIAIIGGLYVLLKQVKTAGSFKNYFREWKSFLTLFRQNDKND